VSCPQPLLGSSAAHWARSRWLALRWWHCSRGDSRGGAYFAGSARNPFDLFSHPAQIVIQNRTYMSRANSWGVNGRSLPDASPRTMVLLDGRISGGKGTFLMQFFVRIMAWWKLALLPALAKLGFWESALSHSLTPRPFRSDGRDSRRLRVEQQVEFLALLPDGCDRLGNRRAASLWLGRAGGELFLLKRINRERFERLRTRLSGRSFWL